MSKKFSILILVVLLITSTFFLCCDQLKPQKARAKNVSKDTAINDPTGKKVNAAERLWEDNCSFCHNQDQLHDKTAADIRQAFDLVGVMKGFRSSVTDEDIEALGSLLSGVPQVQDYKFITPQACRTCHPKHVEQWSHSLHAKAHYETVYDYYFIKAVKDGGREIQSFCAKCHTPIAVINGSIPFEHPVEGPGDTKVTPVENDGIQCDFCHLISHVEKTNNSGYVVNASRTKYGPYRDSMSTFHDSAFSPLHKSAELCGSCHNVNHPVNGIVLEATYTEWKNSPYAAEGITCQDCHMTTGLTERKTGPGKASVKGPDREHVSEHFFVGPNLIYGNSTGAERLTELSRKLLASAAKVQIGAISKTDSGLSFPVMVTNIGAGHYIPTGVTEIRELWLEIIVTGDQGQIIHHDGALDRDGNIEQGAIVYFTDVIDKTGASTTQFWNTVKKVSDRRIPPRETVTETIEVPLLKAQGPLTIDVVLNYRSVSPRGLAEVGVPQGLVEVPVIPIATAKAKFGNGN